MGFITQGIKLMIFFSKKGVDQPMKNRHDSDSTLPAASLVFTQEKMEYVILWHSCLGHMPFAKMKILFPD